MTAFQKTVTMMYVITLWLNTIIPDHPSTPDWVIYLSHAINAFGVLVIALYVLTAEKPR